MVLLYFYKISPKPLFLITNKCSTCHFLSPTAFKRVFIYIIKLHTVFTFLNLFSGLLIGHPWIGTHSQTESLPQQDSIAPHVTVGAVTTCIQSQSRESNTWVKRFILLFITKRDRGVRWMRVRCYHSWVPQVRSIWWGSVWVQMKNKRHRPPDDSSQSHWSSAHCPPPPDSSSLQGPWETGTYRKRQVHTGLMQYNNSFTGAQNQLRNWMLNRC